MKKESLRQLFNKDLHAKEGNSVEDKLLEMFDNFILTNCEQSGIREEVFNVYEKFVPMKQQAPDNMKTVLFTTIRNFAKEEASNGYGISALILYRFLMVKSDLDSLDLLNIAKLINTQNIQLSESFLELYKQKEENKLLSYIELADYYKGLKNYKAAITYYEKFLETDKTKVSLYTVTADLYNKAYGYERLDKQMELYEQAYKLQPNNRLILHGLAFGYEKLGYNDIAQKYYLELLENNPTEIDFYNYGGFLIHCGDFEQGHKYFTHRFNIDDINLKYPSNPDKKWNFKTDISDKVLLIHYEQGFGDTIMYSRFVPFFKKIAKKVIFVVQPELYKLISCSEIFKDIEIITDEKNVKYDLNMALLDTPYILKPKSDILPYSDKYLDITEYKTIEYMNKYLAGQNTFKIGISCRGDKTANYNDRNIELSKFSILKNIPNVQLFNLQKNLGEEYDFITNLGETFEDFSDTAAAIKNMDLVISSDNVILNLAGSLGVKTIGIFNSQTNYRWFKTKGENVGWYNSVKPLCTEIFNDYTNVMLELTNIVKGLRE